MHNQNPWDECPAGVVAEMAGQLRRRQRQTQLRAVLAMGVAVLLFFSAVGYGLKGRDDQGTRAGLTCREAIPLFAKYHDGSLEPAVARDVREHLSHCPSCRKRYDASHPSDVRNRSSAETRLVATAATWRR